MGLFSHRDNLGFLSHKSEIEGLFSSIMIFFLILNIYLHHADNVITLTSKSFRPFEEQAEFYKNLTLHMISNSDSKNMSSTYIWQVQYCFISVFKEKEKGIYNPKYRLLWGKTARLLLLRNTSSTPCHSLHNLFKPKLLLMRIFTSLWYAPLEKLTLKLIHFSKAK